MSKKFNQQINLSNLVILIKLRKFFNDNFLDYDVLNDTLEMYL